MIQVKDKHFEVAITSQEIEEKIAALAEVLNKDYAGKNPLLIGLFNGAFMFAADLVRHLTFNHEIQFAKVSSYEGTETSGKVKELIGITSDLKDRDVIIIEDIVDTGTTMAQLLPKIASYGPKSLEVCTLLMKPGKQNTKIDVKYCAIEIENLFVVGYGLDYDGYGRNYKDIYVITE